MRQPVTPADPPLPPTPRRGLPLRRLLLIALVACLAPAGCGRQETLETAYGRRSGAREITSVNGTAVLGDMFQEAGHRVSSWRRLSPRLEQCDTIVWAPDDRGPPADEACRWLERWLLEQPDRTLVYIGRDFDAEIDYWQAVRQQAPPEQALEVQTRLARAQAKQDRARSEMPLSDTCDWFDIERRLSGQRLKHPEGPWSKGIDADAADLRIASRLTPPEAVESSVYFWPGELKSEPLLYEGEETLISRLTRPSWQNNQLILIDNGCFLLNLPLVNHEHRKLAALLIDQCGPPGQDVVFLESDSNGLPIGGDADARRPLGLEAFLVWPINVLMLHLAVLGIIFSFALFPIFGRPHQPAEATVSDFGKHVGGLGELLQRSGDEAYARQQLKHYHDHVRRDSGVSHRA